MEAGNAGRSFIDNSVAQSNGKPHLNTLYFKNPMMRQSKTKQELVLRNDIHRLEGTQAATREEQGISPNCTITNEATWLKPKGWLAAGVHRDKRKI